MKFNNLFSLILSVILLVITTNLFAQDIPLLINYQGNLADAAGQAITAPNMGMTFSIWSDETSGEKLWDELQLVAVTNGLFNVVLGKAKPLKTDFFSSPNRYLEVVIGTEKLNPRQQICSVPFTYSANHANSASGLSAGNISIENTPGNPSILLIGNNRPGNTCLFINTSAYSNGFLELQGVSAGGSAWGNIILNPNGGNVGIGTSNPAVKLDVNGGIKTSWSGSTVIDLKPNDLNVVTHNLNTWSSIIIAVNGDYKANNFTISGIYDHNNNQIVFYASGGIAGLARINYIIFAQ